MIYDNSRVPFGYIYLLFHEGPVYSEARDVARTIVLQRLLKHTRDLVHSVMKNHYCKKPLTLRQIRYRVLVKTNVQNFIGDHELFFILSIYPDYFFKVENATEPRFTVQHTCQEHPDVYPGHQPTSMIREILKDILLSNRTLNEYLRNAFSHDDYEAKNTFILSLKSFFKEQLKIQEKEKKRLKNHASNIIADRIDKLNQSAISRDAPNRKVSELFSWGNIIRFMLDGDFALWFECPLLINQHATSTSLFTPIHDYIYFIPNPDEVSFTEWPRAEDLCDRMRQLTESKLLYNPSYSEPRMKRILLDVFDLPCDFDFVYHDLPCYPWFYYLKLNADKFDIDTRKQTIRLTLKKPCPIVDQEPIDTLIDDSSDLTEDTCITMSMSAIRNLMKNQNTVPGPITGVQKKQISITESVSQNQQSTIVDQGLRQSPYNKAPEAAPVMAINESRPEKHQNPVTVPGPQKKRKKRNNYPIPIDIASESDDDREVYVEPTSQDDLAITQIPSIAHLHRQNQIDALAAEIFAEISDPASLINGQKTPNNILLLRKDIQNLTIDEIILTIHKKHNASMLDSTFYLTQVFSSYIAILSSGMLLHDRVLTPEHLIEFKLKTLLTDEFLLIMFKLSPCIHYNHISRDTVFNGFPLISTKSEQIQYLRTCPPYQKYEHFLTQQIVKCRYDDLVRQDDITEQTIVRNVKIEPENIVEPEVNDTQFALCIQSKFVLKISC